MTEKNRKCLSDDTIKFYMEQLQRGQDLNGQPLVKSDPSLQYLVNMYLNRQQMSPKLY